MTIYNVVLPKMQKTIEVVYENEVFKPLEKVELREGRKAKVTIEKEKGIITLEDIKELNEEIVESSKELVKKYRLLPNDALIAASCEHYGRNKIATFDSDFKRVDFLEVITPE